MRRGAALPAGIALAMLGGCIAVPVPLPEHSGSDAPHGDPKAAAEIRDGVSTRADVMLALGEPDRAWRGDRCFVYSQPRIKGAWVVVVAGAGGGGGMFGVPWGEYHALLIEFDGAGVVRRHELIVEPLHTAHERRVEAWFGPG